MLNNWWKMESEASFRLSIVSSSPCLMKKIFKMDVLSDATGMWCMSCPKNKLIYHLLGECIKNDPAEVYWESTEQTSKPSHVWSYYTNNGGRTLETETCSSTVIHFAAFTLTCLLNIPSIYKSQLHVLVTWRHIFICLCVLCSGSGDLLFKLTFLKRLHLSN